MNTHHNTYLVQTRYLCLVLAWLLLGLPSIARGQALSITYKMQYNTASPALFADYGLQEEIRQSLAHAYKDVVILYTLNYREGVSSFSIMPEQEDVEIAFMGQKMNLSSQLSELAKNITYKDHTEGVQVEQTSFFNQLFLITSPFNTEAFIIHPERKKMILGFECTEATSPDGTTTIWYTPHILIPNEPILTGVEGVALQVDNGTQIFTL